MKLFLKKGLKFGLGGLVIFELLTFLQFHTEYFKDYKGWLLHLSVSIPIWLTGGIIYSYLYHRIKNKRKTDSTL